MHRILPALILFLVLSLATLTQALTITRSADCVEAKEGTLATLINHYRVQHGVRALVIADSLSASSEHMVQDMSHHGYFGHHTWGGSSPGENMQHHGYTAYAWTGQNIAAAMSLPQTVLSAWINSPEHNANLLDPKWRVIGIGYTHVSGSPYGTYWDADFGSADAAPADWCG